MTAAAAVLVLGGTIGAWACAPQQAIAPAPAPAAFVRPAAAAPPAPAEPSPELIRSIEARIRAEVQAEHRAEHAAAPRPASGVAVRDRMEMSSTAYCLKGLMRTGVRTRDGMAAADPRVLPLGSVVRVSHSDGRPIGVFVVMDTGGAVRGNKIDIYMDSCREASAWGRRAVVAEVLSIGRS
jgi:3D (Asp-Asp-Asp) domain-containing protein